MRCPTERDDGSFAAPTHPQLLLLRLQIGEIRLLLLDCFFVVRKVSDDESASESEIVSMVLERAQARHVLVLATLLSKLVTHAPEDGHAKEDKLVVSGQFSAERRTVIRAGQAASRSGDMTDVEDRGTIICVKRSYLLSHSLTKFLCACSIS